MAILRLIAAFIPFYAAHAWQVGNEVQFEVASVKIAEAPAARAPVGCRGGPGTTGPGTWSCPQIPLSQLIFDAYDLESYRFKPADWMAATRLSVAAKVPAGTTREQFRKMQKNLLQERFKLAFHWQPTEMSVYDLVIGKSGLKMQESAADAPSPEVDWSRVPGSTRGSDGYPVFPAGAQGLMGTNNHLRWRSSNVTMADIVKVLRRTVGSDVVDRTGLKGKYDIDMNWQQRPAEIFEAAPPFEGPDIDKAIQDRLGLKLESKKGTVEVMVVDRIEKIPVEN
jgi:uncharacterized protein (TIGR03435 family)